MINHSNINHGIIAVVMMISIAGALKALGVTADLLMVGGAFATGWFISREYSQAEGRIDRATDGRLSAKNLMPWQVVRLGRWSTDSIMDQLVPILTVVTAWWIAFIVLF